MPRDRSIHEDLMSGPVAFRQKPRIVAEMSRRWVTGLEIATSVVAAAVLTLFFGRIHSDPIDRMGQVSALATIGFRFLLVSIPLVGALGLSARVRDGAAFETVNRFVCAAFAGIASAAFAGGILFALRGTPYGLGGTSGDSGALCQWTDIVKRGDSNWSSVYPPLQIHFLAWLSNILGEPPAYAMKWFQILGTALYGPAAYAAWRLLMRPGWALGLAIISMLPLIEPYRPYAGLVLIVLVPILLKFLLVLQDVGNLSLQRVMQYAAMFGLGLGLLCLLYSGWYQWSAPGMFAAVLILFPWRDWRRGALFCGIAGLLFVMCVLHYVMGFRAGPGIKDSYVNLEARIDPTYFATTRQGTYEMVVNQAWPPLGELGGVGLFTLLLTIGLGVSLTLGRRQTTVIALVSIITGCWLLRLYHAHNMFATKLVQLYPRTSGEILCCMLVLCVFALYLLIQRCEPTSVWRSHSAATGVLASLVFVVMSASSSSTDLYLPRQSEDSLGHLAWISQQVSRKKPSVARGAQVVASSSLETPGFSARALTDGKLNTFYSSALGRTDDHEETIELHWEGIRLFSHLLLFPASDGFPLDLSVDVWDGQRWVNRREVRYLPEPYESSLIDLPRQDGTTAIRLRATRLRQAKGSSDYVLRLAEIELR
jgi:galactan 5-O-arabinofuranosyltransferase